MQKPTTLETREVADGGASPEEDGEGVSLFGAELVDDASGEEEADAVGNLEGR